MIRVAVANEQSALPIDEDRIRRAVTTVLQGEGIAAASISVAVVDDPTIHELNRRYLNHDYETDVLSFVLDDAEGELDGELIVSADTATRQASEYRWNAADELLLYVVHGTLHLAGFDDHAPDDRRQMREKEVAYLLEFGLRPPYDAMTLADGESPA